MCANFKPLKREHSYQLDLLEPTFDYKSDVYPSDDCPIILSHQNEWEWRKALYTTNFTEPLSYQDSAFLKLPKFP